MKNLKYNYYIFFFQEIYSLLDIYIYIFKSGLFEKKGKKYT